MAPAAGRALAPAGEGTLCLHTRRKDPGRRCCDTSSSFQTGQGGPAPPLPLRPRPTLCGLGCVCGGSAPQPHCWDPGGKEAIPSSHFLWETARWDSLPYPLGPASPALRPWWGGAGMTPLLLLSITQHTGRWGGSEGAGFREQTLGMRSRTRRTAPTPQPPTPASAAAHRCGSAETCISSCFSIWLPFSFFSHPLPSFCSCLHMGKSGL